MSSFGGPGGGQKVFKPTPYVIFPQPSHTPSTTPLHPSRVDRTLFQLNRSFKPTSESYS